MQHRVTDWPPVPTKRWWYHSDTLPQTLKFCHNTKKKPMHCDKLGCGKTSINNEQIKTIPKQSMDFLLVLIDVSLHVLCSVGCEWLKDDWLKKKKIILWTLHFLKTFFSNSFVIHIFLSLFWYKYQLCSLISMEVMIYFGAEVKLRCKSMILSTLTRSFYSQHEMNLSEFFLGE